MGAAYGGVFLPGLAERFASAQVFFFLNRGNV